MGGQIQVGFNTMPVAAPHVRSGKMRLLAVTEDRRSPAFPDTPTVGGSRAARLCDAGLVRADGAGRRRREAIALLNKEVGRVLNEPDIRERFTTLGVAPTGGTPDAFGAFIKAEVAKFTKLVADTGMKVE